MDLPTLSEVPVQSQPEEVIGEAEDVAKALLAELQFGTRLRNTNELQKLQESLEAAPVKLLANFAVKYSGLDVISEKAIELLKRLYGSELKLKKALQKHLRMLGAELPDARPGDTFPAAPKAIDDLEFKRVVAILRAAAPPPELPKQEGLSVRRGKKEAPKKRSSFYVSRMELEKVIEGLRRIQFSSIVQYLRTGVDEGRFPREVLDLIDVHCEKARPLYEATLDFLYTFRSDFPSFADTVESVAPEAEEEPAPVVADVEPATPNAPEGPPPAAAEENPRPRLLIKEPSMRPLEVAFQYTEAIDAARALKRVGMIRQDKSLYRYLSLGMDHGIFPGEARAFVNILRNKPEELRTAVESYLGDCIQELSKKHK